MATNKVTSQKHSLNDDIRCIFVGTRFWCNVPKKDAKTAVKELQSTLARDPWYCDRRGY